MSLARGGHVWRFVCEPGDEPALVAAAIHAARSSPGAFTASDAALVARLAAETTIDPLRQFLSPGGPAA